MEANQNRVALKSPWIKWGVVSILFVICAAYIARSFDWTEIGEVLRLADLGLLWLGSSFSILSFWALRSFRWMVLSRLSANHAVPYSSLYWVSACSMAFSLITPLQSGELVKIEWLRKVTGITRLEGYSGFALERVFDLITVVQLGIIGIIFGIGIHSKMTILGLLFVLILLISGSVLLTWLLSIVGPWKTTVKSVVRNLKETPAVLLVAWILSIVCWLIVAVGWNFCLMAIGIQIGFTQVIALTTSITLITLVSMVPGGFGVSEVSIFALLGHLGVSEIGAQTGAIAVRCYGLVGLILGVLHFLFWIFFRKSSQP